MIGFFRILTAATLALHLMMGCCWHHAHACELAAASDHGGATHDGHCSHGGCGHSHHGTHQCKGERCSFVSLSRSVNISITFSFQTSSTALLDKQIPGVGSGRQQCIMAAGWLLLPVRLHLANQILLI
jgi:hypothetical protein